MMTVLYIFTQTLVFLNMTHVGGAVRNVGETDNPSAAPLPPLPGMLSCKSSICFRAALESLLLGWVLYLRFTTVLEYDVQGIWTKL